MCVVSIWTAVRHVYLRFGNSRNWILKLMEGLLQLPTSAHPKCQRELIDLSQLGIFGHTAAREFTSKILNYRRGQAALIRYGSISVDAESFHDSSAFKSAEKRG